MPERPADARLPCADPHLRIMGCAASTDKSAAVLERLRAEKKEALTTAAAQHSAKLESLRLEKEAAIAEHHDAMQRLREEKEAERAEHSRVAAALRAAKDDAAESSDSAHAAAIERLRSEHAEALRQLRAASTEAAEAATEAARN